MNHMMMTHDELKINHYQKMPNLEYNHHFNSQVKQVTTFQYKYGNISYFNEVFTKNYYINNLLNDPLNVAHKVWN